MTSLKDKLAEGEPVRCKHCQDVIYYAKKPNGFCFSCNNAGVPKLLDEAKRLRAALAEIAEAQPADTFGLSDAMTIARAALEGKDGK